MRFAVIGAGAIGAYIGARMARAGAEVTLFARGPHLKAMQERGVEVLNDEGEFMAHPRAVGSLEEIGGCDVVLLGVKAHALPALAPRLKPLLSEETTVVSTQNGVPWWFFQGFGGAMDGTHLESVDPGGGIAASIPATSVVGSIVYFSTEVTRPGVIQHVEGNRISLGEPDGSRSERSRAISQALIAAGLRCPITTRIRHEIWVKILGNASFNPLSALTGATLVRMCGDREVRAVVAAMMQEAERVAAKLGIELPVSIEQRIAGAEKVGEHKTSMLQDLEAGRPLELEAVAGALLEIGEKMAIPMPHTRAVYASTKLMAAVRKESRG